VAPLYTWYFPLPHSLIPQAPEILKLQKYSIKTDLWSVGAILFEILTNSPPFPAKSQIELVRLVDQKKKIEFPPHISVSEDCVSLVQSLLQQDPMKRISWEEFFLHPWLGRRLFGGIAKM
jgi:serine/threonine protein kinase